MTGRETYVSKSWVARLHPVRLYVYVGTPPPRKISEDGA